MILLTLLAAAASTYDRGLHMNGALLQRLCTGAASETSDQCESYVVGVMDGMLAADDLLAARGQRALFLCPTRRIAVPAAVRSVRAYLNAIPSHEQLGRVAAANVIARALAADHPCPAPAWK